MSLKRKELIIKFLIILTSFYFYYFYIFSPQISNIKFLKETLKVSTNKLEERNNLVSKKQAIHKEYNKLDKKIKKLNNNFFLSIKQEYILMILNEIFENSNVEFDSIQFVKEKKEKFKNQEIQCIKAIIPMKCIYNDLMIFLKKIRKYPKKIIIDHLKIESIEENILSISISLNFYSLTISTEDNFLKKQEVFEKINSIKEDPFIDSTKTDKTQVYETDEIEPIVEEINISKKILLDGFERVNTFFVGSNKKIQGNILTDTQKNEGNYSLKVTYNFISSSRNSIGNLVYENKDIYIAQEGELGISIYSFQKNNHKIGVVIKDMNGKSHVIPFANKINWTGWKYLKSSLSAEIAYPAFVERIYIQSINFDPVIGGTVLFDNLEINYE